MELLRHYEQFRDLYREIQYRSEKIYSNCQLPNRVVTEALSDSEIYWEKYPQGFVLFTNHQAPESYQKLFYFLNDVLVFPNISVKNPLIIEELDASGKREAYITQIGNSLLKAGFTMTAKNHMVIRSCEDLIISTELKRRIATLASIGCQVVMDPKYIDISEIINLWKKYLKPTDLPAGHLYSPFTGKSHIICVIDPEGCVCGVNWWECRNNICEIRHTVTRSDFRRKHIGNTMILFALEQACIEHCKTAFTYVEENNATSLKMYEQIGFYKNGKISVQYIKPASQ